jgi:aminoglycoside phosphotransferase (APT) family kinase protein
VHTIAPDDIVRTHEEGAQNERDPLLVTEPLEAFLDANGIGSGTDRGAARRRGPLERHVRRHARRRRGRAAPAAARAAAAQRARRAARGAGHRRLRGQARVPGILAVCDDEQVIGAPFFVMDRVEGHVVTSEIPADLDSPDDRRRMGEQLVDALVEVHGVDWAAAGLEGFGKPTGYLERQLRRFGGLWEHNRTREIEAVERVGGWLRDNLPDSGPATIVHGDFRLGNVMFAPSAPAELVAIFDWEMATIGDPLADLGYLCTLWTDRDDPDLGMFELSAVTRQEGFPAGPSSIARYEERSGRSMTDIRWYQTLALWKSVVFMEGNYKRAVSGATDDPFLKTFGEGVLQLAERAEEIAFGA